jgi:hypothetical protein
MGFMGLQQVSLSHNRSQIFDGINNEDVSPSLELVDDIKRKYYPRSEVPGFLFRRVKALLDFTPLNNTSYDKLTMLSVSEAARNDCLYMADLMIQSQGGITHRHLNQNDDIGDDITHVVIDESHVDGLHGISNKLARSVELVPNFVERA